MSFHEELSSNFDHHVFKKAFIGKAEATHLIDRINGILLKNLPQTGSLSKFEFKKNGFFKGKLIVTCEFSDNTHHRKLLIDISYIKNSNSFRCRFYDLPKNSKEEEKFRKEAYDIMLSDD